MLTTPSIVAVTTKVFVMTFAQIFGAGLITSLNQLITIGTTSSLVYEELAKVSYTIDTTGAISVINILIDDITTDNSVNAEAKFQISGDGGVTFKDITGNIGAGAALSTTGAGLWINSIDIGVDKFQIRLLGRSTDGSPATINIYPLTPRCILEIHKTSI